MAKANAMKHFFSSFLEANDKVFAPAGLPFSLGIKGVTSAVGAVGRGVAMGLTPAKAWGEKGLRGTQLLNPLTLIGAGVTTAGKYTASGIGALASKVPWNNVGNKGGEFFKDYAEGLGISFSGIPKKADNAWEFIKDFTTQSIPEAEAHPVLNPWNRELKPWVAHAALPVGLALGAGSGAAQMESNPYRFVPDYGDVRGLPGTMHSRPLDNLGATGDIVLAMNARRNGLR